MAIKPRMEGHGIGIGVGIGIGIEIGVFLLLQRKKTPRPVLSYPILSYQFPPGGESSRWRRSTCRRTFTSLPLCYVSSPLKKPNGRGILLAPTEAKRGAFQFLLRVGMRTAEAPGVEHIVPSTAPFATRVIVEHGHE